LPIFDIDKEKNTQYFGCISLKLEEQHYRKYI